MVWIDLLKVEQYDPCCEGARTSIVSILDTIMKQWNPADDITSDTPQELKDVIKELESQMKEFREFLLELNCDGIRDVADMGHPKAFADDGEIAKFWMKHITYLKKALVQCDSMETEEEKLEFNTDLFEGRLDWT
tara:strand:+ start:2160 stop:2564 length:405 start_codon:yes stop_codon:yes gene_type:complete